MEQFLHGHTQTKLYSGEVWPTIGHTKRILVEVSGGEIEL
jgi:hypothetical protein